MQTTDEQINRLRVSRVRRNVFVTRAPKHGCNVCVDYFHFENKASKKTRLLALE